jgi:hypothetical protein
MVALDGTVLLFCNLCIVKLTVVATVSKCLIVCDAREIYAGYSGTIPAMSTCVSVNVQLDSS